MICCILALFVAGPVGILLAPAREPRRDALQSSAACCQARPQLARLVLILFAFLLLAALVAVGLDVLDPPMFRRLCTFSIFP